MNHIRLGIFNYDLSFVVTYKFLASEANTFDAAHISSPTPFISDLSKPHGFL